MLLAIVGALVTSYLSPLQAAAEIKRNAVQLAAPDTLVACIQPLGPHDRHLARTAKLGIEHLYGFTVRILKPSKLPQFTYVPARKRHRAERILDYLDRYVFPDSGCNAVIGLTSRDISSVGGSSRDGSILGLATIGGPSGVVSSYRLRRRVKRDKLEKRTIKVVNHELGHVLGLGHLDQKNCVMTDATDTVAAVDAETGLLCAVSQKAIEARYQIALPRLSKFDWGAVLESERY